MTFAKVLESSDTNWVFIIVLIMKITEITCILYTIKIPDCKEIRVKYIIRLVYDKRQYAND